MACFVAGRSGEIGIRMARGATRSSVVAMVLRGVLGPILIGLGWGIPAALLAGHLMASQFYAGAAYDPPALLTATLVLGFCATRAGFLPARRAASIEPMPALRTESPASARSIRATGMFRQPYGERAPNLGRLLGRLSLT